MDTGVCLKLNMFTTLVKQISGKKLWSLKVPHKIKSMIWRAVTYSVPTLDLLVNRRVNVINVCPMCQVEAESILHVFVNCPIAKRCWDLIRSATVSTVVVDFSMWIARIFDMCSSKECAILVTVVWNIWNSRNAIIWNNER